MALERFISEHLARDSRPPDYWRPRVEAIKTEPQTIEENLTTDSIEPSSILNLNQDDQGVNMTIGKYPCS